MLELDFHAARLDLRFLEDLGDVVDRPVRDARHIQQLDPYARGLCEEDRLQEARQLHAVLDALAVRCEARIGGELGAAGDLAEFAVEIVVAAGEDDAAVLGAERLIRSDVRVQVADPRGRLAGGEVVGVLVGEKRDLRVEEREIEMLPGPALRAVRKRRTYRDRSVHAGDDVGDGDAGALRSAARRAVRFAGDAHHAAHALDHEVVAGALAIRAGLAEARDRAVDEARVDLLQVLVGETVAREIAELIILYEHVRDRGELAHELLALGPGDVERDRFLAAVGRGVIGRVLRVAPVLVLHPGRTESARVVARARTLDLDHFGAEIGEVLPRPGAGEHARKIEHADVRKRSRHEFSVRWRRGILSESVAPALRNATIAAERRSTECGFFGGRRYAQPRFARRFSQSRSSSRPITRARNAGPTRSCLPSSSAKRSGSRRRGPRNSWGSIPRRRTRRAG